MEEEQPIGIVGTGNIQEKVDISERFEVKDLENPRFDERPFLEELKIICDKYKLYQAFKPSNKVKIFKI